MSATNCPETPRQKMISMMYLVLTAMLALNVSTEVLNGFTLVQRSLSQNIASSDMQNNVMYQQFQDLNSQNPAKVGEWLNKAKYVREKTDSLYNVIEQLKVDIVKKADGPEGDVNDIKARDNLNIGGEVALLTNRAKKLKKSINRYADEMSKLVAKDTSKVRTIKENFKTTGIKAANGDPVSWENAIFETMPIAASITLLTKIQSDLKNTEAGVTSYLKNQVDASDFRVNKIEGLVISQTGYVTRGGKYSAKIVLAAMDSTKKPTITVNGRQLTGNAYDVQCGSVGT